jgi:hypothetical protein
MAAGRVPKIVIWLAVPVFLLVGLIAFVIWFGVVTEQYYYVAFGSDEYNLSVRSWNTVGIRYALIEIVDHDDDVYVLLEAGELDHALRMFEAAKTRQSSSWHDVGVMAESHERNPGRLTVSAGPGVRFAILDGGVCLSYDLPPADFAAFERAALRARKHFDGDEADRGLTPGSVFGDPPASAFQSLDKAMSEPVKHTNQGCR